MKRRTVLIGWPGLAAATTQAPTDGGSFADAVQQLATLEREDGGRLGVCVRDTGSGRLLSYRADERFPLCSTFKAIAAAAVLARVDRGEERLDRRLPYGQADLQAYAPIAKQHVAEGAMSVGDACAAAVVWSDNTAANLLLKSLGGPAAVTAFARAHGDTVTRLDRTEPSLNTAVPGDARDTTSPAAVTSLLQRLLLGTALSAASRERLVGWMRASPTGAERLRAGLPAGWAVADKTGTGENGTANVIALVHRPANAPLAAAVYLTQSPASPARRNALHAEVGRVIGDAFAPGRP